MERPSTFRQARERRLQGGHDRSVDPGGGDIRTGLWLHNVEDLFEHALEVII
jgi:hypothetical protein